MILHPELRNDLPENNLQILDYIHRNRGFDFSASRHTALEEKIGSRLNALDLKHPDDYIACLESDPDEWTKLIDLLTVNVSRFFRNTLTFETLSRQIIPGMIQKKEKENSPQLRIWSAGCSGGEEPYSMAILVRDILEKETLDMDVSIFATDINAAVLKTAQKGWYAPAQLENVRLGQLKRYFTPQNNGYVVNRDIKKMITFSVYDIMDSKTYVPPESVFGDFDIVLCRNLLIYFHPDRQMIIFKKLYRSLAPESFLVLGEAEQLFRGYKNQFGQEYGRCHIYRKYS